MPVLTVPSTAVPGTLNSETIQFMESICNVGSRVGATDGSVDAWVQVCIVPVGDVGPDAFGRFMHVCVEFSQPAEERGKRRRNVPAWSYVDGPSPIFIECDPGWLWIGSTARVGVTGGRVGDQYNVTMTTGTMKQESDSRLSTDDAPFYQVDVFEPPFEGVLTALSTADTDHPTVALPGFARHHSKFRIVAGAGTWGGVPIRPGGYDEDKNWLPLSGPITVGLNTIYQTKGAV
jgi:hypothetical protein